MASPSWRARADAPDATFFNIFAESCLLAASAVLHFFIKVAAMLLLTMLMTSG
jgi:hypothetical protein